MTKVFLLMSLISFTSLAHGSDVVALPNLDIVSYDCSMSTVHEYKGKCVIGVRDSKAKEGPVTVFKASPEVAAPYSNGYGDISTRPMTGLTFVMEGEEILRIRDAQGRSISTKIDYSR